MPLQYRKEGSALLWVRNPFTGVVTYFTDIRKKRSGFSDGTGGGPDGEPASSWRRPLGAEERAAVRRSCPFCPGNEPRTMAEVLRVLPHEVAGEEGSDAPWLIRAFYNIVPRVPEECTGGRNESYVVVEDPRHFADDAQHVGDLLYTGQLSLAQLQAVLRADAAVARLAFRNPAVRAALIRKNQGRESGASQPHVHNQVIGCDRDLPPVVREHEQLLLEPDLWRRILDFAAGEDFLIEQREGGWLYFCPFGTFPRSYEIVFPDLRARVSDLSAAQLDAFTSLLHRAVQILGPLPMDYEVHDGPLVPLHAHVNARHFAYSNIGGTLNLPTAMPASSWRAPVDAATRRRRSRD